MSYSIECIVEASNHLGAGPLRDVPSMAPVKHPAVHDHFAAQLALQPSAGSLFRIRGLPGLRFAG